MGSLARVFAAVPVPVEVRIALAHQLSDVIIPGRQAPMEDWHITLRFLGQIDEPTLDRFVYALSAVSEVDPFRLDLAGIGAFPNPKRATVVWIGVANGRDSLALLNEVAERAAVSAGLAPEDRPFQPHLTVARVRPPRDVSDLTDHDVAAGWKCNRVIVYESLPGSGNIHYKPLDTLFLKG